MIRRLFTWLWGRSIRRQLIAGVAFVHMLLMSVFVYDLTQRQKQFLVERAESHALFQAQLLATSSVHDLISNDTAALAEILTGLSRGGSIRYAMVTDLKGHVLGHTDAAKSGSYLQDERSLSVLGGEPTARLIDQSAAQRVAAAPLRVDDRALGWAFVAVDFSADQAHLGYVTRAGLFYTLVAILLGTLFAVLLARAITGPLELLLEGTRRVAKDELDQPIPIVSHNEVGTVAEAFNDAMKRLASQRHALEEALAGETKARGQAEAASREAQQLAEELEERVTRRTAELANANRELESFSYSVSHDLRAPLRSMDGFSLALMEDYSHRLDEEGTSHLQRIRKAAQRMGQMIDDMLLLASVTRADIQRRPVNVSKLVQEVIEELGAGKPLADVELRVQPDVWADGDARLLRQVLQNLLGNALKYSRNRKPIRVEFGCTQTASTTTLWVRDNGAGFNMAMSNKLFKPFQRLHSQAEFEGTGVGLATVQRIIFRHGGRIWAEAEEDRGATFFFELPRGSGEDTPRS